MRYYTEKVILICATAKSLTMLFIPTLYHERSDINFIKNFEKRDKNNCLPLYTSRFPY